MEISSFFAVRIFIFNSIKNQYSFLKRGTSDHNIPTIHGNKTTKKKTIIFPIVHVNREKTLIALITLTYNNNTGNVETR